MAKSSIFYDRNRQVMRCFGCAKTHPVMAKTVRDPDAMYALKEQLTREHSGCMAVPVVIKTAPVLVSPSYSERFIGPINCC